MSCSPHRCHITRAAHNSPRQSVQLCWVVPPCPEAAGGLPQSCTVLRLCGASPQHLRAPHDHPNRHSRRAVQRAFIPCFGVGLAAAATPTAQPPTIEQLPAVSSHRQAQPHWGFATQAECCAAASATTQLPPAAQPCPPDLTAVPPLLQVSCSINPARLQTGSPPDVSGPHKSQSQLMGVGLAADGRLNP